MFKNEEEVIEEWLTHYIEQGVDHFYLIDNGSTDNYMDVIKPYMNRITLIHDEQTGNDTQIPIYNRHIKPVLHESTWVIGIDLDEFMYTKTGTIASTLRAIDDNTIGQILVPWKYFGSSGHLYQPKSLRDSFVYRKQTPYLAPTKMICKSEALEEIGIHSSKIRDGYKTVNPCLQFMSDGGARASNYTDMNLTEELLDNSLFKLNHYIVQSLDWFRRIKMTRGSANFGSNHRNEEYFKQWDCNDIFDDDLVHKNYWVFALLVIYILYIHMKL